jgi:uncharacterized protein (DUF2235 family)
MSAILATSTVDDAPPPVTVPPLIPPAEERAYRTLILCFDGTGDQFDDDVRISFFLSRANLILPLTEF